jgi:hypothetical protein
MCQHIRAARNDTEFAELTCAVEVDETKIRGTDKNCRANERSGTRGSRPGKTPVVESRSESGESMKSRNPEREKRHYQSDVEKHAAKYKARPTSPLGETPRPPIDICSKDDQHRAKEETYWIRQTLWQKVTAFAAIGAFIAAAVYASYAKRQVGEMVRQNKQADQQFTAAQRAWLGIDGSPKQIRPIKMGDSTVQAAVELMPKNFGNSPAINISSIFLPALDGNIDAIAKISCYLAAQKTQAPGYVLFPHQDGPPMSVGGSMSAYINGQNAKLVNTIYFVGCMIYGDEFKPCDSKRSQNACHWTRFCFQNWEMDPAKYVITFRLCPKYNDTDDTIEENNENANLARAE